MELAPKLFRCDLTYHASLIVICKAFILIFWWMWWFQFQINLKFSIGTMNNDQIQIILPFSVKILTCKKQARKCHTCWWGKRRFICSVRKICLLIYSIHVSSWWKVKSWLAHFLSSLCCLFHQMSSCFLVRFEWMNIFSCGHHWNVVFI